MTMQIELVSHPEVAILRWHQLVDDPELAKLPYRIETGSSYHMNTDRLLAGWSICRS